jgi:ligand-binding sensor domain-containing protein
LVIGRRTPVLLAAAVAVTHLLAALPARAISPDRALGECSVAVWRVQDGLPGGWIRAITQTRDGYLWIATQGGLARYGGGPLVQFPAERPFEQASDLMGLSVARDGTLWLTPARGQPVCLRGELFSACLADDGRLPPGVRIAEISQDDAGAAWLATPEGILRASDRRLTLSAPAAGWESAPATAVRRDRRGNLWVGTARGLLVRRPGTSALVPILSGGVASIYETASGRLWVAADRTLVRIDADHTEVLTAADGLPAARFTSVIEDRDGNVWVGSREGLIRLGPDRRFTRYGRADGLPDPDVSALFEDREGSLWVGTRAGGLAQFSDRTLDRKASPPSLLNQWVGTLAMDEQGTLWAGTGRGLTRFAAGEERTFTTADGLPSDQVLAVHPAGGGALWVGTDRGLCRFRPGRIEPVAGLAAPVTALTVEADGALWVGAGDGLHRLRAGVLEHYPFDPELTGTPLGEVRAIARDDQGVVWTSANGNLLRVEGSTVRRDRDPIGAALGKVRAIARDADGTLWMGSGDGLIRRRQGRWRIFGAAEGLGRGDLYQVAADDLGSLWVGASHGLLRIGRSALEEVDRGRRASVDVFAFDIWDQQREVRVARTRQPSVWKDAEGRLRFATSRGVVGVDPRRLPANPLPPPVFVERAIVDGRPARLGVVNHFPPGSGALEFQFAAITLLEPRKAQHRYLLEGFDRDWVQAGTRRSAYYTNMKPGRYRFRVQGSNADGVWNLTGDTLELVLAPHFYQTTWFFALVVLSAAAVVLSFHRLRVERLRGRYVATLTERARVAREVHDSLLQGMTGALMHLRGLRKRFAPGAPPAAADTVAGELRTIEEVVASNIEETRHFIWDLRDGKPATRELPPALGELVDRAVAGTATVGRLVVEGDPVPVSRHVHRELLRIAHEALANAAKHAAAAHVEARLRYGDGSLSLTVADDGRGFDPGAAGGSQTGHFGLIGMSERGTLLGRFTLDSQPGKGTRVEVTVDVDGAVAEPRDG